MEGRVRNFERNEAVRYQRLEMTGDLHWVDPSRDARESHTAPSGLPVTQAEDTYSNLGVIQKRWGLNKFSDYSRQLTFIEGEIKRKVDKKGKEGFIFNLSMLFPPIEESGISSTDWSLGWFQLPLWRWITDRVENAQDSIPVPQSPRDQFVEQTRVALLVYQVITKDENLGAMQFRNKGEKKWIKDNRRAFEDQIGNFVSFGRRSFYWEVVGRI